MTRSTARQERRAATLDDPTFERLRSPRNRRRLAAALIAVLALEAVMLLAVEVVPMIVWIPVMVVLVFGLVMALGALKASTRGIEELSPDVLDERQNQIRGLVFARSYQVLSVTSLVALLVLLSAAAGWWDASPEALAAVVVIAFQLVITIPTLVTALHPKAG